MIRKTIIVVLTLAAICVSGSTALSYHRSLHWRVDALHTWLTLKEGHFDLQYDRANRWRTTSAAPLDSAHYSEKWGFRCLVLRSRKLGMQFVNLRWPAWPIIVLVSMYPTIAFIRGPVRRYRRRRKNLCVKCAYDLTGNVTGVCPKCGTEVRHP